MARPPSAGRAARHAAILERLRDTSSVDVMALAREFGVADMTIRRDLAALDRDGKLDRVHGGARQVRPAVFESRAGVREDEKRMIAEAVSELIPPGHTVGLDIGSTCQAVAEVLARRDDLVVVTYSIPVAVTFRASACRLVMLGGVLTDELSLVNGDVLDISRRTHLDTLVLSCAGLSRERGITFYNPDEVEVRRALVAAADRVLLAADHSKLGAHAAFALGPLELADCVVTDDGAPPDVTTRLGPDVEVFVAGRSVSERRAGGTAR